MNFILNIEPNGFFVAQARSIGLDDEDVILMKNDKHPKKDVCLFKVHEAMIRFNTVTPVGTC